MHSRGIDGGDGVAHPGRDDAGIRSPGVGDGRRLGTAGKAADPISLADALARVLTDDTLSQTIAIEGRRVVERRHDVEATSMTLARLAGWQGDGMERGTASSAGAVSVAPKSRT